MKDHTSESFRLEDVALAPWCQLVSASLGTQGGPPAPLYTLRSARIEVDEAELADFLDEQGPLGQPFSDLHLAMDARGITVCVRVSFLDASGYLCARLRGAAGPGSTLWLVPMRLDTIGHLPVSAPELWRDLLTHWVHAEAFRPALLRHAPEVRGDVLALDLGALIAASVALPRGWKLPIRHHLRLSEIVHSDGALELALGPNIARTDEATNAVVARQDAEPGERALFDRAYPVAAERFAAIAHPSADASNLIDVTAHPLYLCRWIDAALCSDDHALHTAAGEVIAQLLAEEEDTILGHLGRLRVATLNDAPGAIADAASAAVQVLEQAGEARAAVLTLVFAAEVLAATLPSTALAAVTAALERLPTYPPALRARALLARNEGDRDALEAALVATIPFTRDPLEQAAACVELAELRRDARDPDGAHAYLQRALRYEPDNPLLRLRLAASYVHVGDAARAFETYVASADMLRDASPQDAAEALRTAALIAGVPAARRHDAARAAVALDPDDARAYLALLSSPELVAPHLVASAVNAALFLVEHGEVHDDERDTLLRLGREAIDHLSDVGEPTEALRQRLSRSQPASEEARQAVAAFLRATGQHQALVARARAEVAESVAETSRQAKQLALARALLDSGESTAVDEAELLLIRLVGETPSNTEVIETLATLDASTEGHVRATLRAEADRAMTSPEKAARLTELAHLEYARGEARTADHLAAEALALDPEAAPAAGLRYRIHEETAGHASVADTNDSADAPPGEPMPTMTELHQQLDAAEAAEDPQSLIDALGAIAQHRETPAQTARDLVRAGMIAYDVLEDPDQAIALLELARSTDPDGAGRQLPVLSTLETLYEDEDDHGALATVYDAKLLCLETAEDRAALRVVAARLVWRRLNDSGRALGLIRDTLAEVPDHHGARRLKAEMLAALGQPEVAVDLFAELAEDPDLALLERHSLLKRVIDLAQGPLDAADTARDAFESILRDMPHDRDALAAAARDYRARGQWRALLDVVGVELQLAMEAVVATDWQALAPDTLSPWWSHPLGGRWLSAAVLALGHLGECGTAKHLLGALKQIDELEPALLDDIATAAAACDEVAMAASCLHALASMTLDLAQADALRARADALTTPQRATSTAPNDPPATRSSMGRRLSKIDGLIRDGRYDEAERIASQQLKRTRDVDARCGLLRRRGQALLHLDGRGREALLSLKGAHILDPDALDTRLLLARAYATEGDPRRAEEQLNTVLTLCVPTPDHPAPIQPELAQLTAAVSALDAPRQERFVRKVTRQHPALGEALVAQR